MPSYGENSESLCHLGLVQYRDVTRGQADGQTDRITLVSTCLAICAIAQQSTQTKRTLTVEAKVSQCA